jgi:RNA polymerase sigma factor (sigma-70 family)
MAATSTTPGVLAHIRDWLSRAGRHSTPDAALLLRFTRERDEAAFAALVDRHGPMVLGVARRMVGDHHLAEDVFQATFLMLSRQAGRLRRPAALPAWLHRTACNLARTALRARRRRDRAESEAETRPSGSTLDELSSRELLAILDEELHRLPETFRLPLVLCCLEGRSRDEAAALLGWTPGSVKGRLERGRQRLKERLVRRGVTFAVGAGVPLLLGRPTLAEGLRQAVLRAVRMGAAAPAVSALVEGATQPVCAAGGKTILAVAALGLLGTGLGLALLAHSREQTPGPAPPPPVAGPRDPSAPPRADPRDPSLPEGAVARLGSSRLRVGNAAFALTPDGRSIVTVTPQGVVRTFDAKDGRLLERKQLTDRGDVDPVGQFHAQLSEDGRTALIQEATDTGGRLTVWDVPAGKRLFRRTDTGERHVLNFGLSPDGKQLAVAEFDDNRAMKAALRVFDVTTGRTRQPGSTERNVYGINFMGDGKRVVVSQTSGDGRGDSTFACFDVSAEKELWRLPRKGQRYAVSPNGRTVVSVGGRDLGFYVIEVDPDSGKPTEAFTPDFAAQPDWRMVIAPDNRTLVMNRSGEIVLWDLRSRKEVRRIPLPENAKNTISGYGPDVGAISPDSRTLVTNVGYLQRWDLDTGKPFFVPPPDDNLSGPIEHLAFTPDGKEVFASSWRKTSGRWDVATGKRIGLAREWYGHRLIRTRQGLRALGADVMHSHEVRVFDPVAGKALHTICWTDPKEVDVNGLQAYTLTTDGKTLLVVHGEKGSPGVGGDCYVTACDLGSGRRLARFTVPAKNVRLRASPFSPCGRWVLLGGMVYHVGTGRKLFAPSGEPDEQLAPANWFARPVWFSEEGRLLAAFLRRNGEQSASRDTLAVWELASGKVLARFPRAGLVVQVAFAPDGSTLALLDARGVRLMDLLNGGQLAEYRASDVACNFVDRGCATQTLAFSPDGRLLATGHEDGTVLLWSVPRPGRADPPAPAAAEAEALWADLGSPSPARGRAAVARLARHPDATAALLSARFRPPPVPADPTLAALIKDLDSDVFRAREEASRKLREYGPKAEPALRRALAGAPSPELRRRAEGILAAMAPPLLSLPLSGESLRRVRAMEVLERVDTPETRKLLQTWAEQVGEERLAAEARDALERLGLR